MAFDYILLIPNLGAKGNTLREKLISLNFGALMRTPTGASDRSLSESNRGKDIGITLNLNENLSAFYSKAISGEHIPTMRIEVNEVTEKTLKTAMVYDFTDLLVLSYVISGSHSEGPKPTVFFSMSYSTVKMEHFK